MQNLDSIQNEMEFFINSFKSLFIASFSSHPVASYAPFIKENDSFYICISSVAEHFEAIRSNSDQISIMFLEDESSASTVFARKRASFRVKATFFENEPRDELFDKFQAKFKDEPVLEIIKNMLDFHIVKLDVLEGRFVKGFGKAYSTDGLKVVSHIAKSHIKNI
ncbi:pyridoxamine 5'-phosphate oxidase [Campylobacter hyointestinalis subsp. hyointestinalis]|uniref:pyridoxamine 5'-phosphate oxidase family protein n=1 Tax=Campylobacter hyointestinalis TaxID=198 RepID=UPI000728A107|nr:pyridoxamine 5'-phosphate oxidase family protein [Campylobacter hyointestinalis]PPB58090.1 pyridoxamine 5'-phosphate oxidase [Campylobacter hyointestinalis subsp. hyointestinalis]QCU00698.1 pyridoxamine 5'-phosphate oxidase [Campylobacter hyointestinalis subsp. hyointestinalis]CUU77337.1 pyridoxamine 5'-phosphate oxidase family protein [Campylobacter hyointestinalis subsp. hyointestinalis]